MVYKNATQGNKKQIPARKILANALRPSTPKAQQQHKNSYFNVTKLNENENKS